MKIEHLGQSGLKIDHNKQSILIDPYLSNSVEILDSPDLVRQVPIKYKPEDLRNINWILISHEHIDHCDPHTIPILAEVNPKAKFIGPMNVRNKLKKWKIQKSRIIELKDKTINLIKGLDLLSVPAAHPKIAIDSDGYPKNVGWLISNKKTRIYISGDTSVHDNIISFLKKMPRIDVAILPVNEDNYFRRKRGIIGNMSIREAFGLTEELKIKKLFPVHWDMFEVNNSIPEEIEIIYKYYNWNFKLISDISAEEF